MGVSHFTNRQWKTLPQPVQEALRLVGRYGNVGPAKQLAVTKPTEAQLTEAVNMVRRMVDQAEKLLGTYYEHSEHSTTDLAENGRVLEAPNGPVDTES